MKLIGYYTTLECLSLYELKYMASYAFEPSMHQQVQTRISQLETSNKIEKKKQRIKRIKHNIIWTLIGIILLLTTVCLWTVASEAGFWMDVCIFGGILTTGFLSIPIMMLTDKDMRP